MGDLIVLLALLLLAAVVIFRHREIAAWIDERFPGVAAWVDDAVPGLLDSDSPSASPGRDPGPAVAPPATRPAPAATQAPAARGGDREHYWERRMRDWTANRESAQHEANHGGFEQARADQKILAEHGYRARVLHEVAYLTLIWERVARTALPPSSVTLGDDNAIRAAMRGAPAPAQPAIPAPASTRPAASARDADREGYWRQRMRAWSVSGVSTQYRNSHTGFDEARADQAILAEHGYRARVLPDPERLTLVWVRIGSDPLAPSSLTLGDDNAIVRAMGGGPAAPRPAPPTPAPARPAPRARPAGVRFTATSDGASSAPSGQAITFKSDLSGATDPFSGVVHQPGAVVHVCRNCQAAYTPSSYMALRDHDDRCFVCHRSFRAGLPRTVQVAGPGGPSSPTSVPSPRRAQSPPSTPSRYRVGATVMHRSFGVGRVVAVDTRPDLIDIVHCEFRSRPGETVLIASNFTGMNETGR